MPISSLETVEINKLLEEYPNARKIAVENFLISTPLNLNFQYAIPNFVLEMNLYNWNRDTIYAILEGLFIIFGTSFDIFLKTIKTVKTLSVDYAKWIQMAVKHEKSFREMSTKF